MQQYFCEVPLKPGEEYIMTKAQAHHAGDVLHMHQEKVRLVSEGKGYFGTCFRRGKEMVVSVEEEDPSVRELNRKVILGVGLIRKEKFEWILQKATELGAAEIIPFESSRCIVHPKKEKEDKLYARWHDIAKSAAEQCKRDIIPEIAPITRFRDLADVYADLRAAAYENAGSEADRLGDILADHQSVLVLIGPEGGFSEEEMQFLQDNHFACVTFGARILRAETAALYACAVISEHDKR